MQPAELALAAVYEEFANAGSAESNSAFQPAKLLTAADFGPDLRDPDAVSQRPEDFDLPPAEWLSQPFAAGWQAPPLPMSDSSGDKPGDFLSTVQYGQWLPPEHRTAINPPTANRIVRRADEQQLRRMRSPEGQVRRMSDPNSVVPPSDMSFKK